MEQLDFLLDAEIPDSGWKFEAELSCLRYSHNGPADIDGFIKSKYGLIYKKLKELGYMYEEDPTGAPITKYYEKMGLNREMFENEDYYTRWLLISPKEIEKEGKNGRKFPLVIVNHGGSHAIGEDEFVCGMPFVAAKERIMVMYAQDTRWTNTDRILNIIAEKYPLDTERIYMIGHSAGGYQVTSTYFRIPSRLTAVAPCGCDIWRDYDSFNVPYTEEEIKKLTDTFVPFMQIVGQYEASGFAPVNNWHPRKDWGKERDMEPWKDPRRDDDRDPTRIHGGRRRFSDMPVPPKGADIHEWMITRLNKRMHSLGCEERDAKTCISYLENPDTELHHVLGFYGDREKIEYLYGYKHYMADIYNKDGIDAFRYVVVENSPHCWPVTTGQLTWDFFKQFRRDRATGKIVEEEYKNNDSQRE